MRGLWKAILPSLAVTKKGGGGYSFRRKHSTDDYTKEILVLGETDGQNLVAGRANLVCLPMPAQPMASFGLWSDTRDYIITISNSSQ